MQTSPNKNAAANAGSPPRLHSHAVGPAWLRFPLGALARRVKKRTITILGLALLVIGIGIAPAIRVFFSRSVHTFALTDSPTFLGEEFALAKARDALDADGLTSAIWQPRRHYNATAPDQYMDRLGDHAGLFIFTNQTDSPRIVLVKLDGNRVVCRSSIAK